MNLSALILGRPPQIDALKKSLVDLGFNLLLAGSANFLSTEIAIKHPPQLLITPLNLPDSDAFEVIEKVKNQLNWKETIIVVHDNILVESFEVLLLKKGADEVFSSTIGPRLFEAKLGALIRRSYSAFALQGTINGQSFQSDPFNRVITISQGNQVALSVKEYELFSALSLAREETLSREQLRFRLWNKKTSTSRVVDVYIRKLRQKLGSSAIQTVHGKGYRINP